MYAQEIYKDFILDIGSVLRDHYEEVAMYQDKIDLNIDEAVYQVLEDTNKLRIYTWREDDDIIGYNVFVIHQHSHYKDHMFAANDIIYIKPEFRHTKGTPDFMNWCEDHLVDEGISVITYHMKENKPFHTLMKDMLGYDHAEHIYTKYIGK